MVIRYCLLSPYDYPLLSAITLWLSVIVRYHPMVIPLSTYDYPLLSAVNL